MILFSLAEPPARILASRRSFRILACSAALDGGLGAPGDVAGGVSAISRSWYLHTCSRGGMLVCSKSDLLQGHDTDVQILCARARSEVVVRVRIGGKRP